MTYIFEDKNDTDYYCDTLEEVLELLYDTNEAIDKKIADQINDEADKIEAGTRGTIFWTDEGVETQSPQYSGYRYALHIEE